MKKRQTIQEQLSSPEVVAMVRHWLRKNKDKRFKSSCPAQKWWPW
jgi:hypothetical protein